MYEAKDEGTGEDDVGSEGDRRKRVAGPRRPARSTSNRMTPPFITSDESSWPGVIPTTPGHFRLARSAFGEAGGPSNRIEGFDSPTGYWTGDRMHPRHKRTTRNGVVA
jgi:hypothetical protein